MSAAASMARASPSVAAIGFSANTGLPALSAAIAICACAAGGTAIATASTSSSAISARQSPWDLGTPVARARSTVRAASLPASATT